MHHKQVQKKFSLEKGTDWRKKKKMEHFAIDKIIDLVTEQNQIRKHVNVNLAGRENISEYDLAQEEVLELLKELKAYKEAEEERLLWKLPCKIGDIVYQVDKANKKVLTQKVLKIELEVWGEGSHSMRIWFETAGSCFGIHFGKTVFFNKAEAMQALEHYVSRGSA